MKIIKELLKIGDFYGESELIEFAKGSHKIPEGSKEVINTIKRRIRWQLR